MKNVLAQAVCRPVFLLGAVLVAGVCVCPADDKAPKAPAAKIEQTAGNHPTDGPDANWVITVNDTVTMNFGPVKVVKRATMRAVNASGNIEGEYTGTFAFHDTQQVRDPHGRVDGTSTSTATNLRFTLHPYLQPLVQPKGDLTPLVKPGQSPDYQGEGVMELTTEGSGKAEAEGKGTTGSYGRKDKMPFRIVVTGSLAKLILPSPKGDVYLNGAIQRGSEAGDDFVPHPLKVPTQRDGGFVPEPLVPPKK